MNIDIEEHIEITKEIEKSVEGYSTFSESDSVFFDKPSEAWTYMLSKHEWYKDSNEFWDNGEATIEAMLGGIEICEDDIAHSEKLLALLKEHNKGFRMKRALDCGAGIGRISKQFLVKHFEEVDIVEQSVRLCESAPKYVGSDRLKDVFCEGLQTFVPTKEYDCIWIQWVLAYLTDKDLVEFMRNCKQGLSKDGVIVVKANATGYQQFVFDEEDVSVTRSFEFFNALFVAAGLNIVSAKKVDSFPDEIYPVYSWILQ
eukprot:TRINITY_DN60013_c0_g2_i1.p1 TRINITY_DN60013_c0_g2~~TRINITY_DN60013_c0_g2_i1.p1  ORF type:complete len:257 (+),score=49.42 TRINITY_DN60013_c0_g2_i1:300-1070(+)